jgi:glycine dehydrogenase
MIEPTESEDKLELDRFVDALKKIRQEIRDIEEGRVDKTNNVLKNAPHTLRRLLKDEWPYPYTRQQAAYPVDWIH